MWRPVAILLLLAALPVRSHATEIAGAERVCLSYGDAADIVASRRVIAPSDAIVAARNAVPGGDILRATLCRHDDVLVYRLTAIRSDGRVVRVTVDAPSGKVQTVH